MAREVGQEDAESKARSALARLRAGDRFDARGEADRLSKTEDKAAGAVADLWSALGERNLAVEHGRRAHRWAVADGEPYVRRYDLERVRALLTSLGAALPEVPKYDPSTAITYAWENKCAESCGSGNPK